MCQPESHNQCNVCLSQFHNHPLSYSLFPPPPLSQSGEWGVVPFHVCLDLHHGGGSLQPTIPTGGFPAGQSAVWRPDGGSPWHLPVNRRRHAGIWFPTVSEYWLGVWELHRTGWVVECLKEREGTVKKLQNMYIWATRRKQAAFEMILKHVWVLSHSLAAAEL